MGRKWLDNYGKEDNYNDSSVSLPEGFIGQGYNVSGRNYSPAWGGQFQMGGSLPGASGMMYAKTIDAIAPNNKRNNKTMISAQDGANVNYSELPYDLKNIKQFYNTMFDSNWYKERLEKNKYPNPENVVNKRKEYTNKTKFTEYENPDSEFDKLLNIFKGKDDLTGSKHSKKDNRISFVKSQADEQFTFPRTIITHEFSHPGDSAYPINNFESNELSKRLNLKGGIEIDEHDRKPVENKADINAMRYDLYKSGNFDPKTGKYKTPSGKFDKLMIQKIKDVGGFDRLKTNYKPEDLIYLFNTIAQNKDDEFIPIAKNGIIKDNNGYWNSNNWGKVVEINSNNITMKGVNQPLLGISDEGDVQYMEPNKNYKFKGNKVREFPIARNGINNLDENSLQQLDQLTNFTNYNKLSNGGWLDKF